VSAPSPDHQERVDLLRSIATLSGYSCDVPIDDALVPDVARLSRATRGLFVGDAKATETSGCAATSHRLQNYLRAGRGCDQPGRSRLLVVAHGDLFDQAGWVAALGRVVSGSGLGSPLTSGSLVIDEEHVLAYARCGNDEGRVSAR